MLAQGIQGRQSAPPARRKWARPFWLDVYDHWHVFAAALVSPTAWCARMRPGRSEETAMRAYERFKATLIEEGVPHELQGVRGDSRDTGLRLLVEARRMAEAALPPVPEEDDDHPELVVLLGGDR